MQASGVSQNVPASSGHLTMYHEPTPVRVRRRRKGAVMNELSVTEEEAIRGLLQLSWSRRRIARETGHNRATIQRAARAMVAAAEEPKPATDSKVTTDPEAAPQLAGRDRRAGRRRERPAIRLRRASKRPPLLAGTAKSRQPGSRWR
jgi:hypothetical protein